MWPRCNPRPILTRTHTDELSYLPECPSAGLFSDEMQEHRKPPVGQERAFDLHHFRRLLFSGGLIRKKKKNTQTYQHSGPQLVEKEEERMMGWECSREEWWKEKRSTEGETEREGREGGGGRPKRGEKKRKWHNIKNLSVNGGDTATSKIHLNKAWCLHAATASSLLSSHLLIPLFFSPPSAYRLACLCPPQRLYLISTQRVGAVSRVFVSDSL